MKDFRELKVWQKAHALALSVYRRTAQFPSSEMYGITSQTRRAASSIPANIAEGCGRDGDKELARFLHIAMGSASELEYHILLAMDLEYLKQMDHTDLNNEVVEVKRMLAALIHKLKAEC